VNVLKTKGGDDQLIFGIQGIHGFSNNGEISGGEKYAITGRGSLRKCGEVKKTLLQVAARQARLKMTIKIVVSAVSVGRRKLKVSLGKLQKEGG